MYPAQRDEIILVLYEKEFLLILCVTIVWSSTLLWYNDVGYSKRISGLEQTQKPLTITLLLIMHSDCLPKTIQWLW